MSRILKIGTRDSELALWQANAVRDRLWAGQLKCFVDRTYSFMNPDYITSPNPSRLAPGKKMVFIMTQGAPTEDMFSDIHPRIEFGFKRTCGFQDVFTIRGCGLASSFGCAPSTGTMSTE